MNFYSVFFFLCIGVVVGVVIGGVLALLILKWSIKRGDTKMQYKGEEVKPG